jgi:phage terminase large subunit-like protein
MYYGFENILIMFRVSRTRIKATLILLLVCTVFCLDRKENQNDLILSPKKSQQINLLDILNELQAHLENWKVVDTSAIKYAIKEPVLFKTLS